MSSSSQRTRFRLVSVGDLDLRDAPPADRHLGPIIADRYTIEARLGGGGMADVYRAFDDQLHLDVAIKLLRPATATPDQRTRMVQEARAAAQVRHPNLVRVFGASELDDTAYIAMELLPGPNLEAHLRERPGERLPWQDALELLLPALAALHAVHERGYVHRDIKPGNIIVTREPGDPPRAVVIDLGLAKPDPALRAVDGAPTTEAGRVLCTPGYASPEQAAGSPVDRRSDVYSAAITLYRVLAGRLPFHAALGKPAHVVFAHHVGAVPTALTVAAPDAAIPPALARVIQSALAKDPADRPPTMQAFAEALQSAVRAATPPPRSRLLRRSFALLLAHVLVAIVTWSLLRPAREQPAHRSLDEHLTLDDHDPPAHRPLPEHPAPDTRRDHDPPAPPLAEHPAPDTRRDHDPPAPPFAEPTLDTPPAPPPTPPPTRPTDPRPTRRDDPTLALHRELAARLPAVQACADRAGGAIDQLRVVVAIDAAGRVSAHADGAASTPLSRCLHRVLDHTTSPPSRPRSFAHVFQLKPIPHPL
jgi:serine/threonine protein kinase